jgi:4-amino-4-deoxy-L-arabinose transferase-like glycosyltransferase
LSQQSKYRTYLPALNRQVGVILLIAISLNMVFLAMYHWDNNSKRLIGDERYYYNLARSYANDEVVHYDLLFPPFQIEWMGTVFRIFGVNIIYIQAVQILLWLLTGLLVYDIARHLDSISHYATYALVLMLLAPELIAFSHYLWPETVHLFFFCLCLWTLIARPHHPVFVGIGGIALGLAILTKSILMPFIPLIILMYIYLNWEHEKWRILIFAMVFVAFMMATIIPVILRNQSQFGNPIIADSSSFNIWVGLNDKGWTDTEHGIVGQEHSIFLQSAQSHQERNEIVRQKIVDFVQSNGVVTILSNQFPRQYYRLFYYESFFISQLPDGARNTYPDIPDLLANGVKIYAVLFYVISWVSMIYSMTAICWRRNDWRDLFVIFLLYNVLIFLILHIKTRFLVQLYPVVVLFGSVGLHKLLSQYLNNDIDSPHWVFNKHRLILGTILSLIFLILAFHP